MKHPRPTPATTRSDCRRMESYPACLAGALAILCLPLTVQAGYTSNGDNYLQASTWVGYTSTGTLLIDADFDFSTAALSIGQSTGANGTVTVTGTGTSLTVGDNLLIGSAGRGTVNLEMGATMTTNKSIYVGQRGTARLNISSGAVLTSYGSSAYPAYNTVNIGSTTAGAASVTVDGAGSRWNVPTMGIGVGSTTYSRAGTLTISNGGVVSATGIGVTQGSSLLVTGLDPVTHAAATLDLSGSFRIDSTTAGAAMISAGGVLNAQGNSFIGSYQGDEGAMTVTGTGSQVNVVGNMTIAASSGRGTLTVADGGLFSVSTTGSALGTGNGTLTVGAMPSSSNPGTPIGVAVLNIGTGGAAGKLNVREVYGFVYSTDYVPPADSTVIFNHNETGYEFTNSAGDGILINGGTKVRQVSGTTLFTAANDYRGGTQITGGRLVINNTSGSGTGSGAVTVSGKGKITGKITVQSGGATLPGNSQILSAGNVKYESGSTAKFTLGAPATTGQPPTAGTDYDRIDLIGVLEIEAGATLELQLTASTMQYLHDLNGNQALGNYFLFTVDSSPILGDFDFLSLTLDGITYTQSILDGRATFSEFDLAFDVGYTGNAATNSLLGGRDLTVQVSSVPEPLTGCLLVMGAVAGMTRRRRKMVAVA